MRSLITGLIGALISIALTTYIARRVGKSATPGTLQFGWGLWVLAFACLVFAVLPMWLYLFHGHHDQFSARLFLLLGFGLAAIYCFGEAAFVKGSFTNERIDFFTPWTGRKREMWSDLVSIELNSALSWYTLRFRSGNRIRLSRYLSGHLSVLDSLGYRDDE